MARYAISQEGAEAMRSLSDNIRASADGMAQATISLQNQIMGCMDGLGTFGFEIWNLTMQVKALLEDRQTDIEQLAEKAETKSNEILELIGLNQVSNTGTGSTGGSINSNYTQGINGISEWIKDINPNYNNPFYPPRGNPYRVNCGSCAFAVESRLQGRADAVAVAQNIGTDEGMEIATGKKCVYMSPDDIVQQLVNMGPGSHLICGINRHATPMGRPQSGHWFNAFYDGSKVYTIDGQSGSVYDWPHDYVDVSEWCALI